MLNKTKTNALKTLEMRSSGDACEGHNRIQGISICRKKIIGGFHSSGMTEDTSKRSAQYDN